MIYSEPPLEPSANSAEEKSHDIQHILTCILKSKEFMESLHSVCINTMQKVVCERFDQLQKQFDQQEAQIFELKNIAMDEKDNEIATLKKKMNEEAEKHESAARQINDIASASLA